MSRLRSTDKVTHDIGHRGLRDNVSGDEVDSDRSILSPGAIQKTTEINVVFDEVHSRISRPHMDWMLPDEGSKSIHAEDKV